MIDNQNLHAFIVVMHYLLIMILFLTDYSKKSMKLDISLNSNTTFSKFITPLTLFIFNKTCKDNHSDFWYIEFALFAANLFISSEISKVLTLKECQYFGWVSDEGVDIVKEKEGKRAWSRHKALKSMIVVSCILVVSQNLLLIFDRIKYEISVTILHSFIVAIVSYLLYVEFLPFRK